MQLNRNGRKRAGRRVPTYSQPSRLANTGLENGLADEDDIAFLKDTIEEIGKLRSLERSPTPIKTDANGLSH